MGHFLLSIITIIGFALLVGVATMLLLWLFRVGYEVILKSRILAFVFLAIVAAVVLNPKTAFIAPLVLFLWFIKVAYVNAREAFRRVGPPKNRVDAAVEVSCLNFLLTLVCVALGISVAFAALVTLLVWPLANTIAKRREWPLLMRTAGR